MTTEPMTRFDFTDPDLNAVRRPLPEFAEARTSGPIVWVEQDIEACAGMLGPQGYWAITTHQHVAEVSRDNKRFSSAENGAIIRFAPDMTREQVELQSNMLINQDAPGHTRRRQIISRGFTPREVLVLRDGLAERARTIVEDCAARDAGDFVEEVAAELPLQAIAELLGVPQEDRAKLFHWSNQMMAYEDPELGAEATIAAAEILGYFMAMAEERKASPRDDIVTKLVTADVDGHGLTSDELVFFVILLTVAGNETTRNAITHGMNAFFTHPEQWELFKRERPATTYDEILRWATPVSSFQRTALVDVDLDGVAISAGERVGLFYASANFDPARFDQPERFDITRDPNPHLAFGGHGAHYCIGASLARMEVELMFNAIADVLPSLAPAGEPERLRHSWINGVKHLPVRYR